MCSRGWIIRPLTSAGWCEATSLAVRRRSGSTLERAPSPGAGYPIHDINSKPDSDGFANRNAYANTYPLNNTHTNSLADTFLASVAVSARRNGGKRVDRYRPRVRADIRWALH